MITDQEGRICASELIISLDDMDAMQRAIRVGPYLYAGILHAVRDLAGLGIELEKGSVSFARDIELNITTVTVRSDWRPPSRR